MVQYIALLAFPGHDTKPGGGERQLALSGNALDYLAIGAGP